MKLFHKVKPVTSEGRILAYLRLCGDHGAFNYELAKQSIGGLAWHRRITDLRQEGFDIVTIRISKGTFKYFLYESK